MVVLGFFFITCSEWPRVFSSSWALWSQSCSLHFDDQNTHFSSAFLLPEVPSLLVPVCLQFDELLFICPIFIYFPPKRPIFPSTYAPLPELPSPANNAAVNCQAQVQSQIQLFFLLDWFKVSNWSPAQHSASQWSWSGFLFHSLGLSYKRLL